MNRAFGRYEESWGKFKIWFYPLRCPNDCHGESFGSEEKTTYYSTCSKLEKHVYSIKGPGHVDLHFQDSTIYT